MNNRRTRNIVRIIISQLAVAFLIFCIGISVVFHAQGYRFNFKNFSVIRTGILFINASVKNPDLYLNGKLVARKIPYAYNLTPGTYAVELRTKSYVPWSMMVKVEPELVSDFRNVVLFRDAITSTELFDTRKIALLNSPDDFLIAGDKKDLSYNNYEVWVEGKLVTRFSQPIYRAIWYPDYMHIIYQQGGEIRVIETTGTNDTLLVTLNKNMPTNYAVNNRGDELYFMQDGKPMIATVR